MELFRLLCSTPNPAGSHSCWQITSSPHEGKGLGFTTDWSPAEALTIWMGAPLTALLTQMIFILHAWVSHGHMPARSRSQSLITWAIASPKATLCLHRNLSGNLVKRLMKIKHLLSEAEVTNIWLILSNYISVQYIAEFVITCTLNTPSAVLNPSVAENMTISSRVSESSRWYLLT